MCRRDCSVSTHTILVEALHTHMEYHVVSAASYATKFECSLVRITHACTTCSWAATYHMWLLITFMLKGAVFSSSFLFMQQLQAYVEAVLHTGNAII